MAKADEIAFQIQFYERIYQRDKRDERVIELLGNLYTLAGEYKKGLHMDRRLVKLSPTNAIAHYNLACSLALLDKKEEAVDSLRDAISYGYADFDWLLKDDDLNSLQAYPAFIDLMSHHHIRV